MEDDVVVVVDPKEESFFWRRIPEMTPEIAIEDASALFSPEIVDVTGVLSDTEGVNDFTVIPEVVGVNSSKIKPDVIGVISPMDVIEATGVSCSSG